MKYISFKIPPGWGDEKNCTGKIIKLPHTCCGIKTILSEDQTYFVDRCKKHLMSVTNIINYQQPCEYCQE